jgi:hypothetical protein
MTTDGAAEAAAADAASREALVLQLGAEGRGRAEIAAALGLSPAALAAAAAEDARLDGALRTASDLAMAWWEALAHDTCAAGRRFNFAGWGREMRRRFGEAWAVEGRFGDGAGSDSGAAALGAAAEPAPAPVWRAEGYRKTPRPGETGVVVIPCNGRMKRRPDGTCPCGPCKDQRRWAAEEAAYYAAYPDQRPAPRPAKKTKTTKTKTA